MLQGGVYIDVEKQERFARPVLALCLPDDLDAHWADLADRPQKAYYACIKQSHIQFDKSTYLLRAVNKDVAGMHDSVQLVREELAREQAGLDKAEAACKKAKKQLQAAQEDFDAVNQDFVTNSNVYDEQMTILRAAVDKAHEGMRTFAAACGDMGVEPEVKAWNVVLSDASSRFGKPLLCAGIAIPQLDGEDTEDE